MKRESVLSAEKSLSQTDTLILNTVAKLAPTKQSHDCQDYAKIKNIEFAGTEDVFNMEVDTHHNFSICGGLIVHNCMDAMRYALEDFSKGETFSFD